MKKKLLLKKETLIRLHEKQMMILGGIGEMSNSQYFDNKVAVNVSCCKRSCLKQAVEIIEFIDESCCKRTCNKTIVRH